MIPVRLFRGCGSGGCLCFMLIYLLVINRRNARLVFYARQPREGGRLTGKSNEVMKDGSMIKLTLLRRRRLRRWWNVVVDEQ